MNITHIQKLIGRTWFDVEENEEDDVLLSTREHGDVGEEVAGGADIDEGRRIVKALRADDGLVARLDVVDEWVHVHIRPKTEEDRADERRQAKVRSVRQGGGVRAYIYRDNVYATVSFGDRGALTTQAQAEAAAEECLPKDKILTKVTPLKPLYTLSGKVRGHAGELEYKLP